jgi:hypothetical protein
LSNAGLVIGNAGRDADGFRGWFVGHFIPPELGVRSTEAVEVKWGTHPLGESRLAWATSQTATSLSLLVRGCIRIFFGDGQEAVLTEPGDYALWPPGIAHRWRIEQDQTVVLTVRWPSSGGDVVSSCEADGR